MSAEQTAGLQEFGVRLNGMLIRLMHVFSLSPQDCHSILSRARAKSAADPSPRQGQFSPTPSPDNFSASPTSPALMAGESPAERNRAATTQQFPPSSSARSPTSSQRSA